jgi:thiamine biosynthesis lipoprotein
LAVAVRVAERFDPVSAANRRSKPSSCLAGLVLASSSVGACGVPERGPLSLEISGATMGTSFRITGVLREEASEAQVRAAVESELVAVSARASTWDPQSELSRFNAHASSEPFEVSAELAALVEQALAIARETGGAFDPTVLPLVRMLGFSGDSIGSSLDPAELGAAREPVGFEKLRVEGQSLVKLDPRLEVDLSAIAPGDAVDRLASLLGRLGAEHGLVEIGGEVRVFGHMPDLDVPVIGVESPNGGGLLGTLALQRGALATSGDYRRFRELDKRRLHHVIDPRTGANPTHDLASVTVLAPTCARADALATALLVLGADEGLELVAHTADVEALFVRRAPDGTLTMRSSDGFPALRAAP